eukprot:m.339115 g.339115  ORF g.339115 m.339115 type:complete len:532 (+) comp18673_c0_seq1:269-1864(+)
MKKSKAPKKGESAEGADPGPSDTKKSGMLSRVLKSSIKIGGRGDKGKQEDTQPKHAHPPRADTGGRRKPGGGTLACSSLESQDYEAAWEEMTARGMPPQITRLHTRIETVLKDKTALTSFSDFLKTRGVRNLLSFIWALEKIPEKTTTDKDDGASKNLYEKYINPASPKNINLPEAVQSVIASSIAKKGKEVHHIFEDARKQVFHLLKNTHFPHYLQSQPYYKYCIDFLTSGNVILEDILYNETAMMGFMDYMSQEGAAGLLQFWLILDNFKEQLRETDQKGKPVLSDAQAKADAMSLYERFFVPTANEFLGVDEGVQAETHQKVSQEGRPKPVCFMLARHLIYTAMRKQFFPDYLQSDFYYQYLNGLVMAVESKPEVDPGTSADKKPQQTKGSNAGPNKDGEEGQTVPTPKRSRSTSLATMDEWGVLHRDEDVCNPLFDEADRVGIGKMLKSGMKSAVGIKKRDTKAELEMAMQISQMIIKDVYREMQEHLTKTSEQELPPTERARVLLRGSLGSIDISEVQENVVEAKS